jgi:hypothetical protein
MPRDAVRQALVDAFGIGFNLSNVALHEIEDVILDAIRDRHESWDDAHDAATVIAARYDGTVL